MYLIHWFGNVWQIGDDSDYFAMIFIKLILIGLVLAVGIAVFVPWLAFKVIQWKPAVGIPLVIGALLVAGIAMTSNH